MRRAALWTLAVFAVLAVAATQGRANDRWTVGYGHDRHHHDVHRGYGGPHIDYLRRPVIVEAPVYVYPSYPYATYPPAAYRPPACAPAPAVPYAVPPAVAYPAATYAAPQYYSAPPRSYFEYRSRGWSLGVGL
jgi:hypothetical protein